jgi:hypothetical protein
VPLLKKRARNQEPGAGQRLVIEEWQIFKNIENKTILILES